MYKHLTLAAVLIVIFTAGFMVGIYWRGADAVAEGYFAHNGQLYQVTGIRPRGE